MAIASLEDHDNGQPRFPGCSNIRDFAFIDKLGEGTFGYVYFRYRELQLADSLVVWSIKHDQRETTRSWP
jgi:hypothetical protein